MNSDQVKEHKCQESVNYICHLGVNFLLDENPLSLGEMCVPALIQWFAKIFQI